MQVDWTNIPRTVDLKPQLVRCFAKTSASWPLAFSHPIGSGDVETTLTSAVSVARLTDAAVTCGCYSYHHKRKAQTSDNFDRFVSFTKPASLNCLLSPYVSDAESKEPQKNWQHKKHSTLITKQNSYRVPTSKSQHLRFQNPLHGRYTATTRHTLHPFPNSHWIRRTDWKRLWRRQNQKWKPWLPQASTSSYPCLASQYFMTAIPV